MQDDTNPDEDRILANLEAALEAAAKKLPSKPSARRLIQKLTPKIDKLLKGMSYRQIHEALAPELAKSDIKISMQTLETYHQAAKRAAAGEAKPPKTRTKAPAPRTKPAAASPAVAPTPSAPPADGSTTPKPTSGQRRTFTEDA